MDIIAKEYTRPGFTLTASFFSFSSRAGRFKEGGTYLHIDHAVVAATDSGARMLACRARRVRARLSVRTRVVHSTVTSFRSVQCTVVVVVGLLFIFFLPPKHFQR